MGQYWYVVNLDKKEYLYPHKLGSGLKLWEQLAASGHGSGAALVILCAAMPVARGGGDLRKDDDVSKRTIGRWAGDRVALIGDYAEDSDLAPEHAAKSIYSKCGNGEPGKEQWTDVTDDVATIIERELDGKFTGDGWRNWEAK